MSEERIPEWPVWVEDLCRSLYVRAQYVLSGNIHDVYMTPSDNGYTMENLQRCLWRALSPRGYELFVVYTRLEGIRVYPDTPENRSIARERLHLELGEGRLEVSLRELPGHMESVVASRDVRACFLVDFASRLALNPQNLSENEHDFFMAMEQLAYSATPLNREGRPGPLFNPVLWIVNKENDLPDWLLVDNERLRSKTLPLPSLDDRQKAAAKLLARLEAYDGADAGSRETMVNDFRDHTDGMHLNSMIAITRLAATGDARQLDIVEAVRVFKLGVTSNPWKGDEIRKSVAGAEQAICGRLLGQQQAVNKTVDILKRSITGLTGAHDSKTSGRPRGVLFFAGPTGVGKTFLAKLITQQLFGDDKAYQRFDMSEFSAEHSDARLLGAPPGYVGFDAGGELTNAVRERPFSVILFDEIEKAHPRILDKFLQILEDGRITDGRGNTVYFSESIIIFTSNLGIYKTDESGVREPIVGPGDPYDEVESRVRGEIQDYFKFTLGRPEILNRIGDNIVVFNFIKDDVAAGIFEGMLGNVRKRVREEFDAELEISDVARDKLLALCTSNLDNGGRGIGNRLETTFVNPLARALFDIPKVGAVVRVADVTSADNIHHVVLE